MNDKKSDLENQLTDYIVTTAKITLGAVPVVGSALAELVCTVIPNQRIDRIAKFAEMLHSKLSEYHEELIRSQLTNENFTEFLEESLMQVIRSTTDERREYIASIVANGISSERIDLIELKHILKILGEVNDLEVIWLRYFMMVIPPLDQEFRTKHKEVLKPIFTHAGLSPSSIEFEKAALQSSYKEHLVQLGLLDRKYKIDSKTKEVKFNNRGQFEVDNYEITRLGRLLLKYISLSKDGFLPITPKTTAHDDKSE